MKKALVVLILLAGGAFVPVGGSMPDTYTVVRGDTLGKIGKAQSVSVSELREWNGIDGDLIEVDQVLKLGEGGPGTPVWKLAWARVEALREPEPVALVEEEPASEEQPRMKVKQRSRRPAPPSDLDEETPSWPPLKMPAAKTCIAADAGIGEGSFGRSVGLEPDQVSAAVEGFQKQTLRCFDGREGISGELMLDLVVGCDGRVIRSAVDSHSTGDGDFAVCVAEVFRYAPFPTHARDEVEFSVPLRYTAGD